MEILIIVIFIAILMLPILFLIGILMMIAGKLWQRKKTFKLGFIFFAGSFLISTSILYHKYGLGKMAPELTPANFVGQYELANAADDNIQLQLYEDQKFEASATMDGYLGAKGRYHVYKNHVSFSSKGLTKIAKIRRGLLGFELRFNYNIPESKTRYALKKTD